jgi:hypothetical protein
MIIGLYVLQVFTRYDPATHMVIELVTKSGIEKRCRAT